MPRLDDAPRVAVRGRLDRPTADAPIDVPLAYHVDAPTFARIDDAVAEGRGRFERFAAVEGTGMAGYSKTPLVKKLGIEDGFRVGVRGAPKPYDEIVDGLPATVRFGPRLNKDLDMVHLFVTDAERLPALLRAAKAAIEPSGMIWVSWPKKSSRVRSTVTEDVIRARCLPMGLVDVKVCAVDDVWSALRLVIRKSERGH